MKLIAVKKRHKHLCHIITDIRIGMKSATDSEVLKVFVEHVLSVPRRVASAIEHIDTIDVWTFPAAMFSPQALQSRWLTVARRME